MAQSFEKVLIHIVFSTKHRTPFLITESHRKDTHRHVGGIVKQCHSIPMCVGGVEDHIHILCTLSRSATIAELVRNIKSRVTAQLRAVIPDFGWQDGYAVFSVSFSQRQQVIDYITNQAEHHRCQTFQDELRTLLTDHELTPDVH